MGSGGKGGGGQQVVTYKLSMHYGVCIGPVDKITGIKIGEKDLNLPDLTENGFVDVDKSDLFGGPKKGGGVQGRIHVLKGGQDQTLPEELAGKLGRTATTVSGFRGLLSLFFTARPPSGSTSLTGAEGFTWGSNNPIVPSVEVTAQRAPVGLTGDPLVGPDANPAHMIYECLNNEEWGAGYDSTQIDETSFLSAAQTLRDESFGLSLLWVESAEIESFVNDILAHINGNLSFNLFSGKWELKLLRDDYDFDSLEEVNPGNAVLENFQRRSWGEALTEIVLTWRNPENEGDETVVQQDISGINIQGNNVSDSSKNFPGIRNQALALRVAERELRQNSAPLAAAEVVVNRTLWKTKPGDVIILNWDEVDDSGEIFSQPLIMRVLKVKYGRKGNPGLRLSLLEDIFSFGSSPTLTQDSAFQNPSQTPIDVPNVLLADAPYFLIARIEGDAEAQSMSFPETRTITLVNSTLTDVRDVDIYSEVTDATGQTSFQDTGDVDDLPSFQSTSDFPIEKQSVYDMGGQASSFPVGTFLYLSSGNEYEIVLVESYSGTIATLARGVLDSKPEPWAAGQRVWGLPTFKRFYDSTERAIGENPDYKFLPITSQGRLPESSATIHTVNLIGRQHKPLRPANLSVEGQEIPSATITQSALQIEVSWSNRNRKTETSVALKWDAGTVSAETGQTTTLRILDETETEVYLVENISENDTTHDLKSMDHGSMMFMPTPQIYRIEVFSVRDGHESHTRSEIKLIVTA